MRFLSESQARTRWCPFYRVSATGSPEHGGNVFDNRLATENPQQSRGDGQCIASECMAWRARTSMALEDKNGELIKWISNLKDAIEHEEEGVQEGKHLDGLLINLHRETGDGYCGLAGPPP